MKKIFILAFSFFFITTSVISLGSASRDAYHSYMMQQARENLSQTQENYNFFTERRRPMKEKTSERQRRAFQVRRNSRQLMPTSKNQIRKISLRSTQERRSMSLRKNRWQQPLQVRPGLIIKRMESAVQTFQTYENETFSIQIPQGWFSSPDTPHFFESQNSDFTVSIKRTNDTCPTTGFDACAISLSLTENRLDNRQREIAVTSKISRQSGFADTILGNIDIQTRIFMEGFSGNILGQEKYIARYFVSDLKNRVYIIETQIPLRQAPQFLEVTKQIFDSFRIFDQDTEL